jgi:hypothetical protein
MKQNELKQNKLRFELYVKELTGARQRLLIKSQNQTFFYCKISLSDAVELAVDNDNYKKGL